MKRYFLVLLIWLTGLLGVPVLAAEGDLDTTFGNGGKVTTAVGGGFVDDFSHGVAIQSDGKIVVAGYTNDNSGDFALTRCNSDGSLDTTFGSGGKVTTSITSEEHAHALALQSDGKIVLAGYADNGSDDFAVVRYNSNGSLDASFGSGGKVTTNISGNDQAYAVVVQTDSRIVLAGYSSNGSNKDFALVRYNNDGSLDSSFGINGKVITPIGNSNDEARSTVLQSDGKIVVVGHSHNGNDDDVAVARYNTNGSLDTLFGSDGKVATPIGSNHDYAHSVALQSDGKIVIAGTSIVNSLYSFALARYNSNGGLDSTFGSGGKVVTSVTGCQCVLNGISIQNDGKIVGAGYADYSSSADFAVMRYNNNGALDTTFGSGGRVITPMSPNADHGSAVAIQSDGKIVVAGQGNYNGTSWDFALARYSGTSQVLTISDASLTEGKNGTQNLDFIISLAPARTTPVTVAFATADNTAIAGMDYVAKNETLTFAPGETSKTISVQVLGDSVFENAETFFVNLSGASSNFISDAQGVGTINNANATALSVSITPKSFSEAAPAPVSNGTVSLDAALSSDLSVTLSSSNTSVVSVIDRVTIPAGQLSASFSLSTFNDTVLDGSQSATVTASASGLTSGQDTVTATDDEVASLSLSLAPTSVSETAGVNAAIGIISVTAASTNTVVQLSSSLPATVRVPASITIPAGQTTADFVVGVVDDAIVNPTRAVNISATSGNLSRIAVLQVTNDDVTPTPTPVPRPANDNFASRLPLPDRGPVSGTTINATAEASEPSHDGRGARKSVWFEWRIRTLNGNATISTQGSNFNTVLAVYEGTSNPAVLTRLKSVASDANGTDSSVTFPARVGVPYYIALDGVNGATGNYQLKYTIGTAGTPTIFWSRAVSGRWNDLNNWKDVFGVKRVPGPADVVAINLPGTYQVQLDVAATVAGFAPLGGGSGTQTLLISGAPLTVTGDSRLATGGALKLTGGTLLNSGLWNVPSGVVEWLGGKMDGTGSVNLSSAGRMEVRGTASKYLQRQQINNRGVVDWYGATVYAGFGAEMNNQPGGRWRFYVAPNAPPQQTPQIIPNGGELPKFNNLTGGMVENESGTLSPRYKSDVSYRRSFLAPDGKPWGKRVVTVPPTWFNPPVENFGTMRSNTGGGFEFRNGGSNGGAITVNNAARARFRSGQMFFRTTTSNLSGTGNVDLNGGSIQTQGAGVNISTSNSQLTTGATLGGNRDIVVGGSTPTRLTWNGGTMSRSAGAINASERTIINRNATLEVQSGTLNGRSIDSSGIIVCNGVLNTSNSAVIENRSELKSRPNSGFTSTTPTSPLTLRNHALLNPGNATQTGAAGALSVGGNLQLMPTGTLNVDLLGALTGQYDTLTNVQNATLDGALRINTAPTFRPTLGTQIRILNSRRRTGVFRSVVAPRTANGLFWNVVSDATGVYVKAEAAAVAPRIANSALPQITLDNPSDGTLVTSLHNLSGRVTDRNGAGLKNISVGIRRGDGLSWNGNSWIQGDAAIKASIKNGRWSVQTDLLQAPDGRYQVQVLARDLGEGQSTLTAHITLRANTSTTPGTPSNPPDSLRVSSGSIGSNGIHLRVITPLSIHSVTSQAFAVTVNGFAIDVQRVDYDATNRTLQIALPASTCRPGDRVQVHWSDLQDSAGHPLQDGQLMLTAQ